MEYVALSGTHITTQTFISYKEELIDGFYLNTLELPVLHHCYLPLIYLRLCLILALFLSHYMAKSKRHTVV